MFSMKKRCLFAITHPTLVILFQMMTTENGKKAQLQSKIPIVMMSKL